MSRKVVYNVDHGGFCLSKVAAAWLAQHGNEEAVKWLAETPPDDWSAGFYPCSLARHSDLLVECVEKLGGRAAGSYCELGIAEVEDLYFIDEYDGRETVVRPPDVRWISALNDPEEVRDEAGRTRGGW